MVTVDEVMNALRSVIDPELKKDIVSMGMIKDLSIDGNKVKFTLELTTPACPFNSDIEEDVRNKMKELGVDLDMKVTARVIEGRAVEMSELLTGVKNVIAVASGKGGVGKSTVAVNLAVALAKTGAKVGLLDADIYGPSVPLMLGLAPGLTADENGKIIPQEVYGMKVMSMGLAPQQGEQNVGIWRGPIISGIIKQFLTDVNWGELDYLIVDLPPGTGDAPLTLAQTIPITGVVVVTTPQNAAMNIALKAALMFKKLGIPIIGVVENMSYFICPHCNEKTYVFGAADEQKIIDRFGAPLVGRIPLHTKIMEDSDHGKPVALEDTDYAQAFSQLAKNVAGRVSVIALEMQESLAQQ
ncbi:MAG: iron-sulfur cluster carrier protein [Candidatus Nitrosocaldaceae archaeon]|nr:MAG: iron-sulfur cluster carrier protein [Candidatus Nitrosocaldaceae archaeon]